MARLDYSMVGSILYAMTIADLNSITPPVLRSQDAGSNVQQKHLNIINSLIGTDPVFLQKLKDAQAAYRAIVQLGNATAGTWTGTDCFLKIGQINNIASLESATRITEQTVAEEVEDRLKALLAPGRSATPDQEK